MNEDEVIKQRLFEGVADGYSLEELSSLSATVGVAGMSEFAREIIEKRGGWIGFGASIVGRSRLGSRGISGAMVLSYE